MERRAFYSFDDANDSARAETVRRIDSLSGNSPPSEQALKAFEQLGDEGLMHWISNQMNGRQCTVVLIGAATANRAWTFYEIAKSWNDRLGVVGVHIHGLDDADGNSSPKGLNPFDQITLEPSGEKLSTIVKCYDPTHQDSNVTLDWIAKNLTLAVGEAIQIRKKHENTQVVYGQ